MKIKFLILILFYILFFNFNNSSIIEKEGDHLFAYFSNLVYDKRNYTGLYEFVSINNECLEWKVLLDISRMMVFESKLSNNLVIAFKGTQSLSDIFSDLNWIPVDCHFSEMKCGKLRLGFLKEYNDISNQLNKILESIDQPYNIYFTGHSLGGAIAVLATMNYINSFNVINMTSNKEIYKNKNLTLTPPPQNKILKSREFIKSINCITFGQPAVGDYSFKNYMISNLYKFQYRRYVNINNHTGDQNIEYDPIATSILTHPNKALLLNCKQGLCPTSTIALHFLDLYKNNLFNIHFTECNTNCKYYESDAKFYKFKYYHCPISSNSIVSGSFNPKGIILHDKYSVCLFTSKIQFLNYSYRNSKSCHLRNGLPNVPSIIIDKTKSMKSFKKQVIGEDLYIVVENHNLLFPTSSFTFNITFSNPVLTPNAPYNLTCLIINETKLINNNTDTIDILIRFNSNNQHLSYMNNNNNTKIVYNVYLSQINNDWKKYQFKELVTFKSIQKRIDNIPKSLYSIVVTADNGFESHTSNYFIIESNINKNNENNTTINNTRKITIK